MLQLTVTPAARGLSAFTLTQPGEVREVRGIALASHLAQRHVSDRMASACQDTFDGSRSFVRDRARR